ncbi:hypothetical protein C8R45DRAFT_1038316 [Mycena sanguinolenta]|nr:hypothetical protein C8R45DRAFT_1038316 [Mycena sanguinolenta]
MKEDPVFPQELLDIIVNHCDLETRRSCALVSSTFYESAHLFSHIRIGPLDKDHSLNRFQQLLENSPTFAVRVASLHISANSTGGPSWMDESQSGEFLSLLISLNRLRIEGGFYWDELSASFRGSVQLTLSRPTLTYLEVCDIRELPITLCMHSPALRSLTLEGVSFKAEPPNSAGTAVAASPRTQLEHLCLWLDLTAFEIIAPQILLPGSPLDISRLRSLTYGIFMRSFTYGGEKFEDRVLIQGLLRASASSLQFFQLKNCEEFPATGVLDLTELADLQTLSLEIWLDVAPTRDLRLLSLGHLIFSPRQRAFSLVFDLHTKHTRSQVVQLLASADSALAALSFIASVTITLCPWKTELVQETIIDVSGVVADAMPLLVNRLGREKLLVLQSPRVPNT